MRWLVRFFLALLCGTAAAAGTTAQDAALQAWQGDWTPGAWNGRGCPRLPPKPMALVLVLTRGPAGEQLLVGYPGGDVRVLPVSTGRIETAEGDDLAFDPSAASLRLQGRLVIPLPDCRAEGWTLVDARPVDPQPLARSLRLRAALLARIENEVGAARESGRVDASLTAARAIERDAEQGLTPGDPVRTRARLRVAEELSWSGRFAETIATIDSALADPARSLPDGDYKIISALEYRAHAIGYAHDFNAQRIAQERVVQLARENFGADHEETMAQVTTLSIFMRGSGQRFVPEAVRMQSANYAAQRALLGPVHLDVLRSSSALQGLLKENGELGRMRDLAHETYQAAKAAYGEHHPRAIRTLNDYGGALLAAGAVEDALRVLREADRLMDEVVKGATNDQLMRKQRLHAALLAAGRYAEAVRFGDELARRSAQAQLPAINSATLLRTANLQSELGQCDQVLPVLEQLVLDIGGRLGPNDSQVLEARQMRARCLAAQGDRATALAEFDAIARAHVDFHSPRHPRLPLLALERARWRAVDEPAAARAEVMLAIEHARDVLGPDHPSVLALELLAAEIDPALDAASRRNLLERARRILGPTHPAVLRLQGQLASQLMQQRDWTGAETLIDGYVAAVEAERTALEPGRTERQQLLSEHVMPYKRGVLVKLALRKSDAAFRLAEQAKARGLLDALTSRRAVDYAGLGPEESARLRNAEGRVRAIDDQLAREDRSPLARSNLLAERGTALAELAAVRQALARQDTRFARLADVRTLSAVEAARSLPPDAVLVSYVVADDRLVAFALRRDRAVRAVELGPSQPVLEAIGRLRTETADSTAGSLSSMEAATLARVLLAPLATELQPARRWIISPDGALAMLPFELLPFPAGGGPSINHATISYTQSASVHALGGSGTAPRPPLPDRMLAVGDPDFASLTPTAQQGQRALTAARQAQTLFAYDTGRPQFGALPLTLDRLPGTRTEVLGVARVRGSRPTDVLIGAQATEARLLQLASSGQLERYRYLLFATHGLLNGDVPLLSAIVLGREGPDDPNDGIVTALKWTGLRLGSDLAVLSACDSGLGRELPGEGIMGLPYALFVAGNRQTVLSLWPVPDRSTARFVTRFFEQLARGLSAAEALAKIKREFAREHPGSARVWAGFVLYGG
jgi:CHAT domain-containing protein/tetratricopeptide (TPR) repeat protein